MRISQMLYKTLKEVPKDAQIPSHQLMMRTGMIHQVASGIYNYLPLALRSMRKIETIIREELDKRGCQEILMPAVIPADLWKESGRWDYYGAELLRFKDRKNNEFCLGPTHEEVITDIARNHLKSYKQLPWNIYQVQSKFRDEVRPRFGLMRGREFIMKDGYSFDLNETEAKLSYQKMYEAYTSIFKRCGLEFRPVDAATGNIGGDMSHEFQVIAETGEDLIYCCDSCEYAANSEKAVTKECQSEIDSSLFKTIEEVSTPGTKTIDDVASFLNVEANQIIKSLLYMVDEEPALILISGEKDLNESKLQSVLGANSIIPCDEETIKRVSGSVPGFIGPVGLKEKVKIVADYSVFVGENKVIGANMLDTHYINANTEKDFTPDVTADLGFVSEGDDCPHCSGKLLPKRGIEVGQVFYLGTKYSEALNCKYLDVNGKSQTAVMGCYGIGIGRTMAASIEQNHDERGIIWPTAIAPYEVVILPLQMNKEDIVTQSEAYYKEFSDIGVDVIIDDRKERAGFKFNDADLIGYPIQIAIGGQGLEKGIAEVKIRETGEKHDISLDKVVPFVNEFLSKMKSS